MATISKERRKRFAEQFSFRQIARIAGWASVPSFMIGYGDSNSSSRFPIQMASSRRHAQRLSDALNYRFAGKAEVPRFGWLSKSGFTGPESLNIEASIRKAQAQSLTGDAAEAIHSVAKEAAAIDDGGDVLLIHDDASPEICYIFVRFFFGLRPPCPFDEWVVLPDNEVDAAMVARAQEWACENAEQIMERLLAQSNRRLGTPSRSQDDEELGEELEGMLRSMDLRHSGPSQFVGHCPEEGNDSTPREPPSETPEVEGGGGGGGTGTPDLQMTGKFPPLPPPKNPWGDDDPDALLTRAKIAVRLGIPLTDSKRMEALRNRLRRFRTADPEATNWIETADPKPRQDRYLFRIGPVWPFVKDMMVSG